MIFIICRGHSGACSLLAVEAISQACGDSSMPCKQFWANERSHVTTHKIVSLLWLYMFKASNWNLSRDASDYGQRNVSKIKKNNQSSDAERRGPLTKAEIQRNYQTGRISLATPFWSSKHDSASAAMECQGTAVAYLRQNRYMRLIFPGTARSSMTNSIWCALNKNRDVGPLMEAFQSLAYFRANNHST